jgi:hypothetical protein
MADQMVQDPVVQNPVTENPVVENQGRPNQTVPTQAQAPAKKAILSPDGWAVAVALLLAALVRLGVLKHVAW